VARPNMKSHSGFNNHPKNIDHSGTALDEPGRIKALKGEWNRTTSELTSHQNQGIEVDPIRRAKIANQLTRDHHRSERTSGKTRGIIKGRVGY
jgi:hypothetical protein